MNRNPRLPLIVFCAIVAASAPGAFAQNTSPAIPLTVSYATGPALVAPGEQILNCVGLTAPYSGKTFTATLQIVDAITGGVAASRTIAIGPPSTAPTISADAEEPPDPCITFQNSTSQRALYIARVALNPQPLPPGIVAFSAHVFSGLVTTPANIRYIPYLPPDPCIGVAACMTGVR